MQHTNFKNFRGIKQQALIVQIVDSAFHWINHYLVDKVSGKSIDYPVDRHLSRTTGVRCLGQLRFPFFLVPGETVTTFLLKGSILNQEKMQ